MTSVLPSVRFADRRQDSGAGAPAPGQPRARCGERAQLLDAGIAPSAINRRLADGSLIPQYRGVYRVGHCAPSVDATYMAAVLACGDGAALCCRSAGHLLELSQGAAPAREVVTSTERQIAGLLTRRCRRLDRRDVIIVRAIRVTSVPRTLVDLAAVLSLHGLARACHAARRPLQDHAPAGRVGSHPSPDLRRAQEPRRRHARRRPRVAESARAPLPAPPARDRTAVAAHEPPGRAAGESTAAGRTSA